MVPRLHQGARLGKPERIVKVTGLLIVIIWLVNLHIGEDLL